MFIPRKVLKVNFSRIIFCRTKKKTFNRSEFRIHGKKKLFSHFGIWSQRHRQRWIWHKYTQLKKRRDIKFYSRSAKRIENTKYCVLVTCSGCATKLKTPHISLAALMCEEKRNRIVLYEHSVFTVAWKFCT